VIVGCSAIDLLSHVADSEPGVRGAGSVVVLRKITPGRETTTSSRRRSDGTPISGEVRGKEAVAERLTNLPCILEFRLEQPQEYVGNGKRVIVLGRESLVVKKSGVTVRTATTLPVFDFRVGFSPLPRHPDLTRWWPPRYVCMTVVGARPLGELERPGRHRRSAYAHSA
jgi:hypothetical protein